MSLLNQRPGKNACSQLIVDMCEGSFSEIGYLKPKLAQQSLPSVSNHLSRTNPVIIWMSLTKQCSSFQTWCTGLKSSYLPKIHFAQAIRQIDLHWPQEVDQQPCSFSIWSKWSLQVDNELLVRSYYMADDLSNDFDDDLGKEVLSLGMWQLQEWTFSVEMLRHFVAREGPYNFSGIPDNFSHLSTLQQRWWYDYPVHMFPYCKRSWE